LQLSVSKFSPPAKPSNLSNPYFPATFTDSCNSAGSALTSSRARWQANEIQSAAMVAML
jgi:hypothetical protein